MNRTSRSISPPVSPSSSGINVFNESEVLPPITQVNPARGMTGGKTIPSFSITSESPQRVTTLLALGIA